MAVFPDNAANSTVDVVLAAELDLEGAVTAVVTGLDGIPDVAEGDLVIVCAGRSELERRAAQTVSDLDTARTGRRALIAAPSGLFPGTTRWSARRLAGCVAVDLGNRGERINHVLVRRDVAGAGTLVAVAALRLDRAGRPPLALGLWPGFVHPRLALAARLGGERVPLVAEIALAFAPRVLVLVGQTRSRALAVATTDRIAADLVGLALRAEYADTDADRLGPWEDPLVQRTTELGLGVRLPRQINLRVVWTDRANDAGALETSSLAARLRLALGIPNAPPRSRSG